jgi:hypothetical protein
VDLVHRREPDVLHAPNARNALLVLDLQRSHGSGGWGSDQRRCTAPRPTPNGRSGVPVVSAWALRTLAGRERHMTVPASYPNRRAPLETIRDSEHRGDLPHVRRRGRRIHIATNRDD